MDALSLFSEAKSQSRSEQHDALAVMLFAAARCRHFYYHTVKTVLAYDAWLLPYDTGYCHTILGYWYTMLGYYHTILGYWHTILISSYTSSPWGTGGRGAERARRVAYSHTMLARECREIRA